MSAPGNLSTRLIAIAIAVASSACKGPNPAYWKPAVTIEDGGGTDTSAGPGNGGAGGGDANRPPDGAAAPDGWFDVPPAGNDGATAPDQVMIDSGPPGPVPMPDAAAVDLPRDLPFESINPPIDAGDPRTTEGLLAYWALDRMPPTGTTISDGRGNTARFVNATWNSWFLAPGMKDGSQTLDLGGVNSYVVLTIADLPDSEDDKTIALWFRSTSMTPTQRNLVSLSHDMMENPNQGVQVGMSTNQFAAWRFGARAAELTANASIERWYHGTYTYSKGIHRLFLDGVQVDEKPYPMKEGPLNRAMIGAYDLTNDELFKGQITDVRIYTRVLTNEQIMTLATPRP